ncbi:MAG TPA: A/G-specific adenine glycosylase [Candidatus Limnocylindrales bacterium]|nr:A/G-specific adenine glycosylase [Candidatus Limnocylindrales bacterium]
MGERNSLVHKQSAPSSVRKYPVTVLAGHELASFRKRLLAWFRQFQRDLPWRRTKDPYPIWISEIMLQQTRVAAVIPYYEKFLARFPNLRALAQAPEEEVLRLWSGLGYYSRARNLQKAAQQIMARHGGEFPREESEVLALPGIGSYTAAAILSIAFGAEHAVLDGNVERVLARLGALGGDLRESRRWQSLQKTASGLLDRKSPGDWNQAMMELGAVVCTPRAPQCLLCPVKNFCRARQSGDPESFPKKKKKRDPAQIVLAATVLCAPRGETLLLPPPRKRENHRPAADDVATLFSRMWHFPTIAIRKDPLVELKNYLANFMPAGNGALRLEPLARVRHAVTYRSVTVLPFRIAIAKIPRIRGAKSIRLEDFSALPVSNLTRKIAHAALSHPAPANS